MEGEQTGEVAVTREKRRRRVEGEQTGEVTVNQGKEKKEGGGGTERRGDCKPG